MHEVCYDTLIAILHQILKYTLSRIVSLGRFTDVCNGTQQIMCSKWLAMFWKFFKFHTALNESRVSVH